jgi:hypothetical protein
VDALPPQPSPGRQSRFDKASALLTLLTAIAVFIATIATEPWWQGVGNRVFGRESSVTIESPRSGATIQQQRIDISGRALNIPKGEALIFVTLAITEGNKYHPSNTSCISGSEGEFLCPPYFVGGKSFEGDVAQYRVYAVLADAETREAFANYNLKVAESGAHTGMDELPETAKIKDSVEISRVS